MAGVTNEREREGGGRSLRKNEVTGMHVKKKKLMGRTVAMAKAKFVHWAYSYCPHSAKPSLLICEGTGLSGPSVPR